ncbi:MAG: hypothetical protein HQK57_15230 [Deltaproteobacteria bacterium]|nr:hypothetical protein [Deltaproteobacteria bacterium]
MEYFDTLSVYDQLRGARFDEEACRVLSNIFRDTQKQQLELLATKRDVEEIKGSIEALRLTTQRDIEEFRQETKRDFTDVNRDIEVLRQESKRDVEISALKLQEAISKSQFELMKEIAGVKKWAIGLIIAQMVLISALKLFS